MLIAHIVAAARNGVIGKDGDLPWKIPEDMKWFRERTKGRALIMGRKTFEAVEHPLPHRLNVVMTRQPDYKPSSEKHDPTAPVVVKPTIEEALEYCKSVAGQYQNEIFIIGGGEIYKQTVPLVNTIYLTRIHQDFEGDAYYPEPDPNQFRLSEKVDHQGPPPFTIETWVRK